MIIISPYEYVNCTVNDIFFLFFSIEFSISFNFILIYLLNRIYQVFTQLLLKNLKDFSIVYPKQNEIIVKANTMRKIKSRSSKYQCTKCSRANTKLKYRNIKLKNYKYRCCNSKNDSHRIKITELWGLIKWK